MIRAWLADASGARELDGAEAVRRAAVGTDAVWIDLDGEDGDTVRTLLEPLGVHPLVLEDMVGQINRPKVDDYGDSLYVAVHSARWERGDRPTLREIDLVVGPRWLVTYHEGGTRSVTAAHEVLPRRPDLLARGPAYLLHFLLDVLVDHYLPIVDQVAEEIDALEDQLFHDATPRVHVAILRVRRGLAAMRRIIGPQRDTVLALTRDEFRCIPADMRPYLRDVYDRMARVGDLVDSFREEVTGLLELYVSLTSNRLNQVIKVLTVIATLMLPLTVITSYYGMNFKLAVYEWKYGEYYVLGVLAVVSLGTWWFLKRRRWY